MIAPKPTINAEALAIVPRPSITAAAAGRGLHSCVRPGLPEHGEDRQSCRERAPVPQPVGLEAQRLLEQVVEPSGPEGEIGGIAVAGAELPLAEADRCRRGEQHTVERADPDDRPTGADRGAAQRASRVAAIVVVCLVVA